MTPSKSTLADVQTIENVRYKMIENRLSLGNYLLSGDLRDEDKTNKGISELQNLLKTESQRPMTRDFAPRLCRYKATNAIGPDNFAKQMIAKRHQVDSGDATVSDLQIFYLQHDPTSWINKSTAVLDQANDAVRKAQDDSNASSASATLL